MVCDDLRLILEGSDECFSNTNNAKEKGKHFSLRNPEHKQICCIRIDDCLITDKTIKKCDFLFAVNNERYYLVELKGVDINTAIEQIVKTYEIVNRKINSLASNYKGVVVSSAVPSLANQTFRNLTEKIYKTKRLKITRSQIKHEEIA